MYAVVLLAAMTSSGPSCYCQSAPILCCPVSHGCCGVIHFFWNAPTIVGLISPDDAKLWKDYVAALDDSERNDMQELWKKADDEGRLKLIAQVRGMRPSRPAPEPEREEKTSTRPARAVASNRR